MSDSNDHPGWHESNTNAGVPNNHSSASLSLENPDEKILQLRQQLMEVRQHNRRLELINSELQSELASLRYRLVDEACNILKNKPFVKRAARLVLPFARKIRWKLRLKAAG